MTNATSALETLSLDDLPLEDLGSIAIRVVVLPPKKRERQEGTKIETEPLPRDLEPDEFLAESGSSPVGSYLESSRGKRCCVFLVNGQRQDSLDNSFIVQELGFKYLRNRMMIVVDVDGLSPEAIGRLMQGSRQGFYKGDIWSAMVHRVVATLKSDPDLLRLEEEAEEQVSELETGDEKVKQTLDQLIDSHFDKGLRLIEGAGASGASEAGDDLGLKSVIREGVVTLMPPERGQLAEYPVLFSQPASSSIRLRPNQAREISIKSVPSNAWPAISAFDATNDPGVPELNIAQETLKDHAKLTLTFKESKGFDADQYPVRAKLRVTARFHGVKEPRQIQLRIYIKPDQVPPDPELLDDPTTFAVSSRQPVKIRQGGSDSHVRLRWNGKDHLLTGTAASWRLSARLLGGQWSQPKFNFSQPIAGRFSVLISPHAQWTIGALLSFEVEASGPNGKTLRTNIAAVVVEAPQPPDPLPEKRPQLLDGDVMTGSNRRPPYELKYINRDNYDTVECWGDEAWTDDDPGCFRDATDRTPLRLIINKDMGPLRDYRRFLTRSYTETEVERRITKYTSHVAFHLYQMYQALSKTAGEDDLNAAESRRREEIQRVAMTLIKLMEVAR